ncbi:MAG: V-type proton ATPase subunit E [Spirochaetaceae bacterium]
MTKEELSAGIIEKARIEADEIILTAEKSSGIKIENNEKRLNRQFNDAKLKAEKVKKITYSKQEKLTSMYINRYKLKDREDFIDKITKVVIDKINDKIRSPEYIMHLENLILEGALGLNRSKMYLNSSKEELNLLSSESLKNIGNKASGILGVDVEILLSKDKPLSTKGIILISEDGRVSYNNLIKSRIKRKQEIINELIARSLDMVNNHE